MYLISFSYCHDLFLLIIHILSARLYPAEVGFLREYCITMKPLLKALNILQSESSVYLGWLLPVIHQLLSKLNRLETSSQTCMPLIRALQNGLQKHFGQMMEDPELAAAAVLLPKFKTSWTDKPDIIEAGKFKFTLSSLLLWLHICMCVYFITSQSRQT